MIAFGAAAFRTGLPHEGMDQSLAKARTPKRINMG